MATSCSMTSFCCVPPYRTCTYLGSSFLIPTAIIRSSRSQLIPSLPNFHPARLRCGLALLGSALYSSHCREPADLKSLNLEACLQVLNPAAETGRTPCRRPKLSYVFNDFIVLDGRSMTEHRTLTKFGRFQRPSRKDRKSHDHTCRLHIMYIARILAEAYDLSSHGQDHCKPSSSCIHSFQDTK
ncbi:hypothetical protein LZ31DRAFT_553555 [Colletotrichum somersetense]|nr:hypothetical protein LZ31DRAFT_553555 [Colletotrichum somersetense]